MCLERTRGARISNGTCDQDGKPQWNCFNPCQDVGSWLYVIIGQRTRWGTELFESKTPGLQPTRANSCDSPSYANLKTYYPQFSTTPFTHLPIICSGTASYWVGLSSWWIAAWINAQGHNLPKPVVLDGSAMLSVRRRVDFGVYVYS